MDRYSFCRDRGMVPSRMPSAKPEMLVMGVFSSWDTLATNSRRLFSDCSTESAILLKASARASISWMPPR